MNITAGARAARGQHRGTYTARAAFAAGAGLLLLAGCSGGTSTRSSSAPAAQSAVNSAGKLAVPSAQGPPRAVGGTANSAAGGAGAAAGGAAGIAPASQAAGLLLASQSIIYTADITSSSRDVTTAAAGATGIAQRLGGYVAAEQASGAAAAAGGVSSGATVSLTLKVPVAQYQTALRELSSIGRRLSLDQRATDVTQQVADVTSRVTSQQAAIAQLRVLLRHAGTVGDLLSVQDQISADESALEALQAQQRSLSRQTTYATVSVLLVSQRAHIFRHRKKSSAGFVTGLSRGWHAFTAAVSWLATALGAVLPFAVILVAAAALGYGFRRRKQRRQAGPTVT